MMKQVFDRHSPAGVVAMTPSLDLTEALLYPQSDGKPMAESTEQYRWIVILKENLEILFADVADVFIAADLLWYPVQVEVPPAPAQAPDVMVIWGRPKGKRRSYLQWKENNIGPQVVFEILSASHKTREGEANLEFKFLFYEAHGVGEYYIYDPDDFALRGWLRQAQKLVPIDPMDNWVSPRLGITFQGQPGEELVVYRPDGGKFLTSIELQQQAEQARLRAQQERLRAQQEQSRAEQEQLRAEQAIQRAEQAAQALVQERERLKQMAAELEQLRSQLPPPHPGNGS
jgi:Uma2 family endonuclease